MSRKNKYFPNSCKKILKNESKRRVGVFCNKEKYKHFSMEIPVFFAMNFESNIKISAMGHIFNYS